MEKKVQQYLYLMAVLYCLMEHEDIQTTEEIFPEVTVNGYRPGRLKKSMAEVHVIMLRATKKVNINTKGRERVTKINQEINCKLCKKAAFVVGVLENLIDVFKVVFITLSFIAL